MDFIKLPVLKFKSDNDEVIYYDSADFSTFADIEDYYVRKDCILAFKPNPKMEGTTDVHVETFDLSYVVNIPCDEFIKLLTPTITERIKDLVYAVEDADELNREAKNSKVINKLNEAIEWSEE